MDNAVKINNEGVSQILQKSETDRTLEEKEKIGNFSTNLESQVCLFF